MSTPGAVDVAGRRRSPATLPGYHEGAPLRDKGLRYPADPPTVEEIVAVMRTAGDGVHALRARALIAVLWRAGLRIDEVFTSPKPTWTAPAGRCSSVTAKATSTARREWTIGGGSTCGYGCAGASSSRSGRCFA